MFIFILLALAFFCCGQAFLTTSSSGAGVCLALGQQTRLQKQQKQQKLKRGSCGDSVSTTRLFDKIEEARKTGIFRSDTFDRSRNADLERISDLVPVCMKMGKYALAEALLVECCASSAFLYYDSSTTWQSMSSLADVLDIQGKIDEAEPLFVKCLAWKKKHLGVKDPSTLDTLNRLELLYFRQGKCAEAKALRESFGEVASK